MRKNGVRLKLQDQPFQVLAALLERPGELVTREELKERLWSGDTFVDFDRGLNTAVNKIREALGDSASHPRFVETVPRRGYQFIYPLAAARSAQSPSLPALASGPPKRVPVIGLAVLLALAVAAAAFWLLQRSADRTLTGEAPLVSRADRVDARYELTRLTFDSGLAYQPTISADGKLVAYASDRSGDGNLDVWVQQVGGGEPVRVTRHETDDYAPSLSPDGTRIAFRSDRGRGGIYVVPALGGAARQIAQQGYAPRFSPDGDWIVYRDGDRTAGQHLYVVSSKGGQPRPLEGNPHDRRLFMWSDPIWSPDGNHVVFRGWSGGTTMWRILSLRGGPTTDIDVGAALNTYGLASPQPEAWQGEGNSVVFSALTGTGRSLWRIPISPGTSHVEHSPEQLTFGTGSEHGASVAIDGRLVFAGTDESSNLWSLPIDANEGKALGDLESVTNDAAWQEFPSISANGKKVVFGFVGAGKNPFPMAGRDVWIKDLESGATSPLATAAEGELAPRITSDGSIVAYTVPRIGFEPKRDAVYVVAAAGGLSEQVCEDCGEVTDWSRDGKRVLYSRRDVTLLDVASGRKTKILEQPGNGLLQTQFSSDGRWLAFVSIHALSRVRGSVFIAPFRGEERISESEWISITDGSTSEGTPRWSPDGNLLYFQSDRDGHRCIWVQRLNPATKQPVGPARVVHHFHRAQISPAHLRNTGLVDCPGESLGMADTT